MSRFFYWLRKIGNYKEFFEGGTVESHKLRYPFKASPNLLTAMFEIRRWFVLNSPHYMKSAQYTNYMAHLHHELNYQQFQTILRRVSLVNVFIFIYIYFLYEYIPRDYKDQFDLKFYRGILNTTLMDSDGPSGVEEDI